jgi:putative tryptophan/tyrosine transport system substrate-binding protein
VFAQVAGLVSIGIVSSMPRPGGNVTGFSLYEPTMGGKRLEILREVAPGVSRVAFMFLPDSLASPGSSRDFPASPVN